MSRASVNILQHTVSQIYPRQDFKSLGHYTKVKSRSYHDIAHLHPPTNVSSKYQHSTPHGGFCNTAQTTFSHRPPAQPKVCSPTPISAKLKRLQVRVRKQNFKMAAMTAMMAILFYKIANLISKLNFYKLIPYPKDNC